MTVRAVRCGTCKRVLDEEVPAEPVEHAPCPYCRGTTRLFDKEMTATSHITALLSWTKTHEEVERHWPWLAISVTLTVAGAAIGFVIGGLLGAVLGVALGLLSYPAGLKAATRVREIEHGGDR